MMLFGKMVASLRNRSVHFSFNWQGQFEGENSYKVFSKIYEAKNVEDLFDDIEDFEDKSNDSYAGASQDGLFADKFGSIGRHLIATMPIRKSKNPYV